MTRDTEIAEQKRQQRVEIHRRKFERQVLVTNELAKVFVGQDKCEPCPVCLRPALLVYSQDRYFHLDGSENDSCWREVLKQDIF